mgnify:CR=1 FL=1
MKQRNAHSVCVGLLACTVFTPLWGQSGTSPQQPNILWIVTDDHRPDSVAAFNRAVRGKSESPLGFVSSPNTDKLAQEGVLFIHAYANAPSCSPSRSSMFTGQYPFRNGVYGFETWRRGMPFSKPLIPEVMAQAGYDTMMLGKLDVRRRNADGKYDVPFASFNERSEFEYQRQISRDYRSVAANQRERYFFPDGSMQEITVNWPQTNVTPEVRAQTEAFEAQYHILRSYTRQSGPTLIMGGESTMPTEGHYQSQVNQAFLKYLDHPDQTFAIAEGGTPAMIGPDSSKPIFVNLGYEWPHTPVLPPKEFRDQFKDLSFKIPDFSPTELTKLPPQLRLYAERFQIVDMTEAEKLQLIQDYYAFCAYGDWLVGQAVEAFKEYSQENGRPWVIIYTVGDHSWHLGENGVAAKFAPYNQSTRCAIIAAASDESIFPRGLVSSALVEFVDIAPTLYALAGVDLSDSSYAFLDGHPLTSILSGEKSREYVLSNSNHTFEHRASIRNKDFVFSMRTRPKGYLPVRGVNEANIRWALEASDADAELALFDLRIDPLERNNVAHDPQYQELAQWFRQKLGNIILGDGRVECNWTVEDEWSVFDFAEGSDDKKLDVPFDLIPQITVSTTIILGDSRGERNRIERGR